MWPPPYPGDFNYSTAIASVNQVVFGPLSSVHVNALLVCGFSLVNVSGTINTFGCNSATSTQYGGGGSNTGGDGSGAGHGGPGGSSADGVVGGSAFGSVVHPTSSGSMGGTTNGGYGGGFAQVRWPQF